MTRYECAMIMSPTLGAEGLETASTKYSNIITSRGGAVTKLDDWGKRSMAYEINDHREGYYRFYQFEGNSEIVDELNRQLRIDENVIRHMIVRDEYIPPPEHESRTPSAREGGEGTE